MTRIVLRLLCLLAVPVTAILAMIFPFTLGPVWWAISGSAYWMGPDPLLDLLDLCERLSKRTGDRSDVQP